MAFDHYKMIWEDPPNSPTDLLVLLCIAEHADKAGKCWPSVRTLAKLTQVTTRCVQMSLWRLLNNQYLTIDSGKEDDRSNLYYLKVPREAQAASRPYSFLTRKQVEKYSQGGNVVPTPVNDIPTPTETDSHPYEPGSYPPLNVVPTNHLMEPVRNKTGNKKKNNLSAGALRPASLLPASPEECANELHGSLKESEKGTPQVYASEETKPRNGRKVNGSHHPEIDLEHWSSPGSEPDWMRDENFERLFQEWLTYMKEEMKQRMPKQRILSERRSLQGLRKKEAMDAMEAAITLGSTCLLPELSREILF